MRNALALMPYATVLLAILLTIGAAAEPIAPGAVMVTDGDTVRANGAAVRLVGLDAPETYRAQWACRRRRLAVAVTQPINSSSVYGYAKIP